MKRKCPYCGRFFEAYWEQDVEDGYDPDEMNTTIYVSPLQKKPTSRAR